MKILLTTDSYTHMTNGVAIVVATLANAYREKGHDVRVLTISGDRKAHQDGMVYYMLSVSYSSGESVHDDSPEDVVDTLDYSVSMWSFTPKTESEVFSINALPDDLSGKGLIYVLHDDVYIGIDVGDLSHNQIVSVLNSIQ